MLLALPLALVGGAAHIGTTGVAMADGGGEIRTTARLVSTGIRPNAAGIARTRDRGSSLQRIDFEITGLNANAPYVFVADGVTLGTRNASAVGSMDVSFRDGQVPAAVKPVSDISRLEVFTGTGALALFADM
jgi:hypothetical protein